MKGKLLFVAGLATGYVVGSRAGRSAYTTLTEKLRAARESDAVQSAVGKAKEVAQERAPKLVAAVSTAADTTASVADAVSSAPDPESESPDAEAQQPAEAQEPAEEQKPSGSKRGGRGRTASTPSTPDSAEEAAKVFEEQLPETAGGADESATPTATS